MKMRQTAPQFRTASSQAVAVMRTLRRLQALLSLAMLVCALASTATAKDDKGKAAPVTVRWSESQPGCTFSSGEDGKYRYGLWSGDIGIVFAVDAREVQIIRHRIEPIFGVFLTIRYRGTGGLDLTTDGITLQFMKHFKVVQTSLDPDDYIQKIQADADAVDDETRR